VPRVLYTRIGMKELLHVPRPFMTFLQELVKKGSLLDFIHQGSVIQAVYEILSVLHHLCVCLPNLKLIFKMAKALQVKVKDLFAAELLPS